VSERIEMSVGVWETMNALGGVAVSVAVEKIETAAALGTGDEEVDGFSDEGAVGNV